ncbi:MAG: hypothetical protein LCH39_01855 [Proteobacteria bacterium]|nr:hypothetical protein [Pseudomonadota bacterium]
MSSFSAFPVLEPALVAFENPDAGAAVVKDGKGPRHFFFPIKAAVADAAFRANRQCRPLLQRRKTPFQLVNPARQFGNPPPDRNFLQQREEVFHVN